MVAEKAMKIRYENRKNSILKKGKELSTLCDVKVCVIVVSPDGKLETWPNNLNDVKAILSAVKGSSKPIRSENSLRRNKKGGGGGGEDRRLCSRIKIPKSVKGKEIEKENCNFGNAMDDEVFYDVSGTDQENNNVYNNNFGMGIPVAPLPVIQAPNSQYPNTHHYYCNQWNGNEKSNYCENFGKYMVRNLDYACGSISAAMNPEINKFCNTQLPNQEPPSSSCGRYEMMGNSSANFNSSGLNYFSNQEPPIPSSSLAYQQYEIGNGNTSTALFNSGVNNFCNMVHPNQERSSSLAYQQYEIGSSSSLAYQQCEIGCSTSLAYQQYEIGIWE